MQMRIVFAEIEGMENADKLSALQKQRLALKYLDMLDTPQNYEYFERYIGESDKKEKLSLNSKEKLKFQKLF